MSFDPDLLDDIFLEPTHAPVQKLGKFHPKARKKTDKTIKSPSSDPTIQHYKAVTGDISMEQEFRTVIGPERSTESQIHASEASEIPSSAVTSPEPIEIGFQAEALSSDFDLESLDTILSQRNTGADSEAILPIHGVNFRIDHEGLQGVEESGLDDDIFVEPTSKSETRVVEEFQSKAQQKAKKEAESLSSLDNQARNVPVGETSSIHGLKEMNTAGDITETDMVGNQKRGGMEDGAWHVQDDDVDGTDSETDLFDDADVTQTYRQLRERTSTHANLDNRGDRDKENWGMGGERMMGSKMVEEESEEDYMIERSFKKMTPHTPKILPDGREKHPQLDTKRKFSQLTRGRRKVDKILLETPEEDINPMKLKIKDLIMLAEARERKTTKEVETTEQARHDQSGNEADRPVKIRLNYHTYMNKPRSERWSKMDTEMFYQAVRQFGTDFAMIGQLFPNRTRHQIKLKFKNEERKHPLQMADAVVHRSKDHSQFQLVIERLTAQEEETRNSAHIAADPAELQRAAVEIEEEDGGAAGEKKEELDVDDWDQQENEPEEHDAFEWGEYDISGSEPNYSMNKTGYDDIF